MKRRKIVTLLNDNIIQYSTSIVNKKGSDQKGLFGHTKRERELQEELDRLRILIPPQGMEIINLQRQIEELNLTKSAIENELETEKNKVRAEQEKLREIECKYKNFEKDIINLESEIAIQEYGLYRPTFKFATSDLYKDRLKTVREKQKEAIKNGTALTGNKNWTVNGNAAKGKKMVNDMQKLLLRAFNVECDDIVNNVKISNFDKSKERINKSAAQISKLGTIMSISITTLYVSLKIDELALALDFEQKKQEEKERIKEARAQQREEARVQKEIEEARKKLQKEQTHYQNALNSIIEQLSRDPNNADLLAKRQELENNIADTNKAIADVDYREANKRAGYVYVISNIGAFGDNMFKIGMTRRLEPMERIDELSGASVPFNFDVHALIFTEDAPGLEAALHHAFESKKVNKINTRREFFRVSLNEIKAEVRKNFDKTVEWIDFPEADQYRQSLLLGGSPVNQSSSVNETSQPIHNMQSTNQIVNSVTIPSQSETKKSAINTIEQVKFILKNYQWQEEDTPSFFRLHIYNSNNQKLGIVKILKPNMIIQFKIPGNPTMYEINSVDELKNFL